MLLFLGGAGAVRLCRLGFPFQALATAVAYENRPYCFLSQLAPTHLHSYQARIVPYPEEEEKKVKPKYRLLVALSLLWPITATMAQQEHAAHSPYAGM